MLIPRVDMMDVIERKMPSLTRGRSLFGSPMIATDRIGVTTAACVFVFENGGQRSLRFKRPRKRWLKKVNVSVVVRSPSLSSSGAFSTGNFIASTCHELFDKNIVSGYINTEVSNGSPAYTGQTRDGFHTWRFDVMMSYTFDEYPVYYGAAADGVRDALFITSLPSTAMVSNKTISYAVDAQLTENIFYAIPTSFADRESPIFKFGAMVGGFTKTIESPIMVDVDGVQTPYDLWVSDNVGLGAGVVTVL